MNIIVTQKEDNKARIMKTNYENVNHTDEKV